jgi:hypothetical protein
MKTGTLSSATRIIAYLASFYFARFLKKNLEVARILGLLFRGLKSCVQFEKSLVGLQFGRFFTNSSGHPDFE